MESRSNSCGGGGGGEVAVVVVPLPAQGHLNQLLQLCCLISSHGLQAHYLGFSIHNQQARLRANGLDPNTIAKIHFHDLPTPPDLLCPSPDPTALIKFPTHLIPVWEAASQHLRHPVGSVLRELASRSRRVVVVHDHGMSSIVQDTASIENAESYCFNCISAFSLLRFLYQRTPEKPFPIEEGLRGKIPGLEDCISPDLQRIGEAQQEFYNLRAGNLHNTSRVIEGSFPDLLARDEYSQGRKQWFIGPILPTNLSNSTRKELSNYPCLDWLDRQPENSVLYVSFGTMTSVSDTQAHELAMGLQESKQRFVWVLRDADKGNVFSGKPRTIELPEGFEETVKGTGLVVREWAPQPEILAHPSTGGFMSHCGWNSCIESITHGVPIAAWPMHSDQPSNAFLVANVLRTGAMVREWADRKELVRSSTVAGVVRKLMASEEGDEMRKRAQELGENVTRSVQEGGVSRMELESFIGHISR